MIDRLNERSGVDPNEFLDALDEKISGFAMLNHPFYQKWNEGKLTKETLANYAKQYYAHVKNFPIYLSSVHSRCDDISVRKLLLYNLVDEESGDDNHPELWLRFAEGLGLRREEVRSAPLLASTERSVQTLKKLTGSSDYLEGVAALYAYESQIPDVARTKREGLRNFYGIDEGSVVSFFTVHEEADLVHRKMERDILRVHATSDAARSKVLEAAETSAKALLTFLDGVHEAYVPQP